MRSKKAFFMTVLFCFFGRFGFADDFSEKPLAIFIASYNNAQWAEKNLGSIFMQDYTNYRIIYVDDHSSDGTGDVVQTLVRQAGQEDRVTLIVNEKRQGFVANICEATQNCDEEEILVLIDGDDWLYDNQVFRKLNQAYSSENIWLTHGSLIIHPNRATDWSIPIPSDVIASNRFRSYRCGSHLKTFYTWLFRKIDPNDLRYQGKWLEMTGDQAIMFPMIEMAGERHAFMTDLLYVYNIVTPLNDNKVNAALQRNLEAIIRKTPPYQRLADRYDANQPRPYELGRRS